MIHVNRKVLLAIESPEIRNEYVRDCISTGYPEYALDEIGFIADRIIIIILKNERIISTYGWESYINEDYPARDYCSGFSYNSGEIVIEPFDWTAEDISELKYSFVLSKIL